MKPETIQDTMRLWQEQPEKAKGSPTVKARSDGGRAVMEAGPFTWHTDLPQPLGGTNEAPSPTALLLSALAGCAVVFIRDTLAPQLGVRVEGVEATAQCEADSRGLLAMEGVAPDLQNLQLSIQIQSSESEDRVQELYRAWQERCPIYLALLKSLQVASHLEVESG
ncbi:MAG: OsmC family protein [Kiloniellales bacterium]